MSEIPAGFFLDDGSRNQKAREDRIIAEAYPQYGEETRNDPTVRSIMLEQAQAGSRKLPDSGQLIYRRYRNPDSGAIAHIPEGDSKAWLPKAEGFKFRFGALQHIDGKPYIKSTLQSVTRYQGIND